MQIFLLLLLRVYFCIVFFDWLGFLYILWEGNYPWLDCP